ncbi:MAG: DUF86 domain-containing protein [Nitrospirota bacterium]
MADDILVNKVAIIERCLGRVLEEYQGKEAELVTNYTRQDAILMNLQRACEASIDAAMHLVRLYRLGVPQESREAFQLLEKEKIISSEMSHRLQAMVGFRNIAIHDYRTLNIEIVRAILEKHLVDFRAFCVILLEQAFKK